MKLTPEQIAAGYSTVQGDFNPITGERVTPEPTRTTTPQGTLSSMGPIVAPEAAYLDPNTGKELPIGSPNPTAPGYTGLNAPAPIVPEKILPRAGFTIDSTGKEVPIINRSIRSATGTDQNVAPASSTTSAPVGSGPGGAQTEAEKAASAYLDTTLKTPKTEEEIIAERTAQSKDKIKSLTDYYNSRRATLQPTLDLTAREANARAVLSGLSGSQEGSNLAIEASEKNKVAINAVEAERANALVTVYEGIQTFAHDEAIRQNEEATKAAEGILARGADVIAAKEAAYKTASEHLATIAKNPEFDLEKIKASDPTTYASLANSVGGEDVMKGLIALNRPATKLVGTPIRMGNVYGQMYIDPKTGLPKMEYIPLPTDLPQEYSTFQKMGDNLVAIPDNWNGDVSQLKTVFGTQSELDKLDIQNKQLANQKLQAEVSALAPTGAASDQAINQLNLIKTTLDNAKKLANASGNVGVLGKSMRYFTGTDDYTNLVAETNTLRTNILTLATDPAIKKFFGPQMSNADVQLMTSAGTTLNPELQTPEKLKSELARLEEVINKLSSTKAISSAPGDILTAPDGSGYVNKAELTPAELKEAQDKGWK